jgi:periodic tryptophan protein 1
MEYTHLILGLSQSYLTLSAPSAFSSWKDLGSDVECVVWDADPARFIVSTEEGLVKCFDARATGEPLYTLHAHDSAVSALSVSKNVPGLVVTGGADRQTRVWDVRDGGEKACLGTRDLGVGKVFSAEFCGDGMCVAVGGSKGKLVVWNLAGNSAYTRTFGVKHNGGEGAEDLAEVDDDDGHESEEDEEGLEGVAEE